MVAPAGVSQLLETLKSVTKIPGKQLPLNSLSHLVMNIIFAARMAMQLRLRLRCYCYPRKYGEKRFKKCTGTGNWYNLW
jgi:hypothetical protein